MLAKGVGSTARSVGRARELEPGHRRDGIALALLGIAVVVAASSWFGAARPVGEWIDTFLRVLIGSAVVLVPIVARRGRRGADAHRTRPEARPRLILGAAMIVLPDARAVASVGGLAGGSRRAPARRRLHRLRASAVRCRTG